MREIVSRKIVIKTDLFSNWQYFREMVKITIKKKLILYATKKNSP